MQEYKKWVDTLNFDHHKKAVALVHDGMADMENVIAVLLGGSISHGYERADSDIDLLIIIGDEEYTKKLNAYATHYGGEPEMTPYDGGYVDGKFTGISFIRAVADRGNDATRYAFMDAKIVYSRSEEIAELINRIKEYPHAEKADRIRKFHSQFITWKWYSGEAFKRDQTYLKYKAVTQMALFGSRLILAHNDKFFPYHKALPIVLETCEEIPDGYWAAVLSMLENPTEENIQIVFDMVMELTQWDADPSEWGKRFMFDSETHWFFGNYPVDDI